MTKVIDIVNYVIKCAHAIGEGLKVAIANWPNDNPFIEDKGGSKSNE